MNEKLAKLIDNTGYVETGIRDAIDKASLTEAMILVPLVKQISDIRITLEALRLARNETAPGTE